MLPSMQALASLLLIALSGLSAPEMTVDPRSSVAATYSQFATEPAATKP